MIVKRDTICKATCTDAQQRGAERVKGWPTFSTSLMHCSTWGSISRTREQDSAMDFGYGHEVAIDCEVESGLVRASCLFRPVVRNHGIIPTLSNGRIKEVPNLDNACQTNTWLCQCKSTVVASVFSESPFFHPLASWELDPLDDTPLSWLGFWTHRKSHEPLKTHWLMWLWCTTLRVNIRSLPLGALSYSTAGTWEKVYL